MRRLWPAVLGGIMVVSVVSCAGPLPTPWQVASETDLDDVRAVVLLRLYGEALRVGPAVSVACVGVERGEPSGHLLMSLSGRNMNLRQQARCSVQGIRLVDPISGARAVAVFVSAAQFSAPGFASAEGGFVHGPLAGRGMAYRLEFKLGRWEIVDERPTWVS